MFSGDWAWTIGADGTDRITVGYVGTLIDTWNGWAVFSCTRSVAAAIKRAVLHLMQLRGPLALSVTDRLWPDRVARSVATDLRFRI